MIVGQRIKVFTLESLLMRIRSNETIHGNALLGFMMATADKYVQHVYRSLGPSNPPFRQY
jgi:hypothetical protein